MLLPDETNHFTCETESCEYKTCDIFDFFDHTNISFAWSVRLSNKYTLDLFVFLQDLSDIINSGELELAYDHVQSISLLLANSARGEDVNNFVEEAVVKSTMDDMMFGIEKMLKENE
jgi:hypothetical protein